MFFPICYRRPSDRFEGKPVGSIHERLAYWEAHFEIDDYVRSILQSGFKVQIDREKLPDQYYEPNNKSALQDLEYVRGEVSKLLEKGCIVRRDSRPRICNPLTVAEKNGKKRLVIDLSR